MRRDRTQALSAIVGAIFTRFTVRRFRLAVVVIAVLLTAAVRLRAAGPVVEIQVSTSPYLDTVPVVRNGKVAWTSFDALGNSNIFLYDIASKATTQVTTTGSAILASLDVGTLVYADRGASQCQIANETRPCFNIFAYDLVTGATTQLTDDVANQLRPVVSGANVVWEDYRNGPTNPDIYGATLAGGPEFAVDTNPTSQHNPALSGNIVVWQDERNATPNIYAMDLTDLGTEIPIATGAVDAESPAIDNGRIVFFERVGPYPAPYQILLYDVATKTTTQLSPSSSNQKYPKISGNRVLWEDDRNQPTTGIDLYGFDLATGVEFPVDAEPGDQILHDIDGTDVVFADTRNGNQDIFLLTSADTTPPTITIISPTSTTYALNQAIAAQYTCSDADSGVATCVGPVPGGSNIDTASVGVKTFTVNAMDNTGNAASQTVTYRVGYGICPLYDQTKAVKSGATVPIKLELCDAVGFDVSASSITVTATGVNLLTTNAPGPLQDVGNANPDNNFRFDQTLGTSGGYIYNLSSKGLGTGTYVLSFRATNEPMGVSHMVQFQVR